MSYLSIITCTIIDIERENKFMFHNCKLRRNIFAKKILMNMKV